MQILHKQQISKSLTSCCKNW